MTQVENSVVAEAPSNGEGMAANELNNMETGDTVGTNGANTIEVDVVSQPLAGSCVKGLTSKHPRNLKFSPALCRLYSS